MKSASLKFILLLYSFAWMQTKKEVSNTDMASSKMNQYAKGFEIYTYEAIP
jgi:hypothetical protein